MRARTSNPHVSTDQSDSDQPTNEGLFVLCASSDCLNKRRDASNHLLIQSSVDWKGSSTQCYHCDGGPQDPSSLCHLMAMEIIKWKEEFSHSEKTRLLLSPPSFVWSTFLIKISSVIKWLPLAFHFPNYEIITKEHPAQSNRKTDGQTGELMAKAKINKWTSIFLFLLVVVAQKRKWNKQLIASGRWPGATGSDGSTRD